MTNTEFRKAISESANVIWFNSVDFELNFPAIKSLKNFTGLSTLHKFAIQQIKGWEKYESLPSELNQSLIFFRYLNQEIENFLNSYTNESSADHLNSLFTRVRNNINARNSNIFTFDSSQVEFLLNVYSNNNSSFIGAFTYLIGDLNQNITNKDIFNGYLSAYEFTYKDSDLSKRHNSEKSSLQKLKDKFENSLPELDQQLVSHLKNTEERYVEYAARIDGFQTDKEKTYSDWFINTKGDFETFDKGSKDKLTELENTYKEKLKLEGPATYWSDRAKKLRRQGWMTLAILVLLVLIVCDSLSQLLWRTPEQIYSSFFNNDKSTAIRWAIVYVTLISFLAFCIKALSKVMFSSFHLARDSEERHTLTYFYLALLKDSTIEAEEKKLIMQSLFSRTDTGLLKEDSSPTMPSDIAKVIGSGK